MGCKPLQINNLTDKSIIDGRRGENTKVVCRSQLPFIKHSCLLPFLKAVKIIEQMLWQFQSGKMHDSLKTLYARESDSTHFPKERFTYGEGSHYLIVKKNIISSDFFAKSIHTFVARP